MRYIIIILLSSFLISCGNKDQKTDTSEATSESNVAQLTPQQKKNIGLQLGKLTPKNVSSILKLSGQIDVPPQNMISISIPLGGFLKSTQLLPGMHVRKGQFLATLEDQQYILLQQNYLTTKVKLKQAEADYKRQKALNANQASSDKIFQQASADYETLKIQLSSLAQELRLININANNLRGENITTSIHIISPIDGYVTKVNANIGKHVDTNEILFELVNPDD
ncbi:MAG: efflux RND transporter periplasmic adaptor subunit, partial [Bacteroidetes bacterium]|nr:efflux RND transporter periplasmic adaptor subunit [Bacteroidota bacterium]